MNKIQKKKKQKQVVESSICWVTILLATDQIACLETSMRHHWPTIQLKVAKSRLWQLHLVSRKSQLGLCAIHYLVISFISFSYILRAFYCLRFPYYSSTFFDLCCQQLNPISDKIFQKGYFNYSYEKTRIVNISFRQMMSNIYLKHILK